MSKRPASSDATLDPAEVAKFERLAGEWWDADGKFRPLHKLNPVRLGYIRDIATEHFRRDVKSGKPLSGLRVLDVGCGGGLLTEPMARLGGDVLGIDPAGANIEAARRHAGLIGLAVDYRETTAEALAASGETFDIVLAMEVVEHVPDMRGFLGACAALVKPGGLFFTATINRTPKAFALAIVGAEYLLRWLPRGTHDYSKLVRPEELEAALSGAGLSVTGKSGVRYDPFTDRWSRSDDLAVNYMMAAEKAGA
jgi:2-polyprenyl-6-hydroxyphenyl methylase / 3-demethylubiquinone-9 3-methyltransferase